MEKKNRSKNKLPTIEYNEKFQRFRSKIKKTFSKSIIRSDYSPRRKHDSKKSKEARRSVSQNRLENVSERSNLDINNVSTVIHSTMPNNHKNQNNLHNQSNNSFHCLISLIHVESHSKCDVCHKKLRTTENILVCKFCRTICHKKCCDNIKKNCPNNQLYILSDILDSNQNVALNTDNSTSNQDSLTIDFRHRICDNSTDTINNRISAFSVTSTASLLSQIYYDFTTLDRNRIATDCIEVTPISPRQAQPIETQSGTGNSSSINSCKSSVIYNEQRNDLMIVDWTVEDLIEKSNVFNKNSFGLSSEMTYSDNEIHVLGTIRVYINLLRPVHMEFTSRPLSLTADYDNLPHGDVCIETMWLPKGTSKLIYVNQSTTVSEVIDSLLKKFRIKAQQKKFGLYEHTIEGEKKVIVRKLSDNESPLGTLLARCNDGIEKFNEIMSVKRLVLQENENGDIEWAEFSIPELNNFLLILSREEHDIANTIKLKYSILKMEIIRLQDILSSADDVTVTMF